MQVIKLENLNLIANLLKTGKIIIFPTETSYGLGCDATNQTVVDKIFKIKGRSSDKPLLVVVPDVKMAKKYLKWNATLDDLAKKYWPGALTVVGQYNPPSFQGGGKGEVGQRIVGNKETVLLRRNLRQELTKAEKILWRHLKAGHLGGLKIRRQHGVGPYVVDFYHADSKTIIEIDGDIHFSDEKQVVKDKKRTSYFEKLGYKLIRINNVDVFGNLNDVLSHLYFNLTSAMTSPGALSLKGEGHLASGVVAPDGTVAVRVTADPFLQSLIKKLGRPIVATSANISGENNLYSAQEVMKVFGRMDRDSSHSFGMTSVDAVVDGGELAHNLPSTLVSVVGGELKILRQGEVKFE